MQVSLVMALVCCVSLMGCAWDKQAKSCPYQEFIVVDVLDLFANYQGMQSGWFGELVKKKFNMELNIITPNISGGGDRLFEVRAAAGNLGDLIGKYGGVRASLQYGERSARERDF